MRCPSCTKPLKVPDHAAGKKGKCPNCGNVVAIPNGQAVQPAAARAAAVAPTYPAAAAPGGTGMRPSAAAGSVAAPGTFQKLYLLYVAGFGAGVVVYALGAVLGVLSAAAIVSDAGKAMKQQGDALEKAMKEAEERSKKGKDPGVVTVEPVKADIGLPWYATLVFPMQGLGGLLMMAGGIAGLILLYKEWSLIQDGQARTSPGQAIGFLFIPFFNLYWMFVAHRGLAEDLNNYARQRGIQAREVSVGFVTAALVLCLVPCLPGVGLLMMLLAMNSIKNICVDIAQAKWGTA